MTQIMATWKLLDVNDDGAVNVSELIKALVPFGESEEKVAQMINVADENGDGTVIVFIRWKRNVSVFVGHIDHLRFVLSTQLSLLMLACSHRFHLKSFCTLTIRKTGSKCS